MQNRSQSSPQPVLQGRAKRPLCCRLFFAGSFLTLVLITLYISTPLGESLDAKVVDFLLSHKTSKAIHKDIATVTIDDSSLKQYGQWPWPRYRLAMLLDKIQTGGGKIIAVNILFPELDRTSPVYWKTSLPADLGYTIDTSAIPETLLDHDAYLANSLAGGNYVLGYGFLFDRHKDVQHQCTPSPAPLNLAYDAKVKQRLSLHKADDILCNNPTILQAGTPSGFFNAAPDADGVLRRLPLLIDFNGKIYPSFVLKLFLQSKEHKEVSLEKGPLQSWRIAPYDIPIDHKGSYLISSYSYSHYTNISAAEVLGSGFDPAIFKDKIIFVGITASGLVQEYHLATGDNVSMVDIHRLVFESLTAGLHSIRGDYFWIIEALLSLLLTSLFALLVTWLSTPWSCTLLLFTLGSLGGSSMYLSLQWGLLFSPLLAGVCLILTFLLLLALKYKYFQKYAASEAGTALQLLETTQANLQSILSTIPDIVFRLDNNGRIIFLSSAIAKYRSSQAALLGQSIFDLVVPEDLEKAKFKLNERRTGLRATHDLEIRLQLTMTLSSQEKEVRYFSVSAAGLYKNTEAGSSIFLGTQGIAKDITRRKQIEKQLLQAKKMEAIGSLAAGVAHDLNNILSGLVSYPDIILADLSEDDPLHKKISLIKKSGQKASIIVQDLLTLARRNILPQEVCDLNVIISDYLESTEHKQAEKNYPLITIKNETAKYPVNFIGSSVHLAKVVMNLINNAIEAMPAGGDIVISTSRQKTEGLLAGYENIPPGDYACLSIKDNGMGIPAGDLSSIFEPFYTKKPTRSKGTGTGLGMTIIWATIKDHKGYIDISSSQEKGTTLDIYLPATDEQAASQRKQISHEDYRGKETILVVDDLDEQLTIAGNILHKLGYNAITVQNGAEALSILSRASVDLVILDMIMPGQLDGLETYEKILQLHPGQKAIISSGYSESKRVQKMQELGAGGFVQKPYSMEDLARAVRRELDR